MSFLSGLALVVAAQGMVDSFLSHSAFLVKEVEVQWPESAPGRPDRFRLNPPSSVFRVELNGLSQALERRYPLFEVERVERVLPNRLRATMGARRVVAQIQAGGAYYLVSDDGTVLAPGTPVVKPQLPVLILEGFKRPLPARGGIASAEFWRASELLATIRRDGGVAGQRVTAVRVSGRDLFLALDSGLELRFSSDRLAAGWQRLADLLRQRPQVLAQAQYVDLRFEDPVIADRKQSKKRKH